MKRTTPSLSPQFARPAAFPVRSRTLALAAGLAVGFVCATFGAREALAQPSSPRSGPPPAAKGPDPDRLPPELEPYEGRPVRHIILKVLPKPPPAQPLEKPPEKPADQPTEKPAEKPAAPDQAQTREQTLDEETETLARNQIRMTEGRPYTRALASDDISRLNRLGRFKRVESRVQMLEDGSVNVFYLFALQPVIADVQSVGNRRISDGDIQRMVGVLVGTPADDTRLDRYARRIEDKYREKGYYNCQVSIDKEALEKSSTVVFKVREGDRTRVTAINFEGNLSFSARELKKDLKTKEWFGFFEKGPVDDDALSQDIGTLRSFYNDRGYLDVHVDRMIRPSLNGKEAVITFIISEGPVYTLRSVKVDYGEGDEKVFSPEQYLGLMSIKPGDVYSEDKLKRSVQAVKDAYGKMGYCDATVERHELRDPIDPQVDIKLFVSEGKRFRTGEVIVRGNDLTRSEVIRREVTVQPDRPLDSTGAEDTKQRLRARSLFAPRSERVTIQPEDPNAPRSPDGLAYRDVLVEVEETNTGNFSVGGAIGSDAGVTALVSLRQRNFDGTDTPDTFGEFFTGGAFRGAGQTFQIDALPGDRQQVFSISLSEPSLFESDYSGSAAVFFKRRDYNDFTELRYGSTFSIGRRFGRRWSGTMPIRIESIGLSGLDPSSPTDYFKVQNNNLLTSVGFSLRRNTFDDEYRPSRGTSTSFGVDQVGALGGKFYYNVFHAEHNIYVPVKENFLGRPTVMSLRLRSDYTPQSFDKVPVYERQYLGGNSFRGFDFRGVGPRGVRADNGLPSDQGVGGNFAFFAGLELKQPLYEDLLAGVVFLDTGTVNKEFSFRDYRASVGVGLRVFVDKLSPVPLAFDFGFPIRQADGDKKRLFTFSVDIPFY